VHAFRAERCARPPTDPERATITYRLARLYYDANAFRTAVVLFDEVARDPLAGEVGPYAAQLALDALNVRLRQVDGDARTDCLQRFGASVDAYAARYCAPPIQDEDLCAILEQLRQQVGTALAQ
jgi:hypothetical protein